VRRTQFNGPTPNVARESLVSYERRIAGGAFKAFLCLAGPRKKITLVNKRSRHSPMNDSSGILIVLDANAIGAHDKKSPIPAGRIEKAIPSVSDRPSHKRRNYMAWRVERPQSFSFR
jgi:hypothetical protein